MTTIQERLESLWYSRRIEKPYERDNQIFINVYSSVLERGLDDTEYLTDAARTQAASLLLDYYGRNQENQNVADSVSLDSIHFPNRALSSPILKIAIPKTVIDDADQLIGDAQNYSFFLTSAEIRNFQNTIGSLFPVYQQQLKFFNGSVTPNINFLDLQDKIALFFVNLDSFITFNGYNLRQFQKVGMKLDSNFMVQSVILQKKEVNNLVNIPIVNGVKFYFETKKEGSNKYVNEIVSNANQIMLDTKMKINWTQFIYNYLPESGVAINFYGKPRTETAASQANSEQEQGPFGPLASTKQEIEGIRASINNRTNQQKAFQEANKEIESINTSLQGRLRDITSEIQNVNNEADQIKSLLNKFNISTLIEAALECLLFKQGFSGALPDFIPGMNPFEPQASVPNFKLPEIPVKLPIVSINKQLQIEIRENLKRAALSALMAAIEAVAAIIREFCLRDASDNPSDNPSDPAQNVVNDFLSPLEDENALNNCYRDFNFIVSSPELFEIPSGYTESSVLEAYLTNLSPLITPRELCDLFNDVGSDDVLQIAGNLIDSSWPQLRQNFADGEAIQSFFACLGNLVDPSYCVGVYNDQTQTIPDVDPCTIEDSQPYQDIVELLENVNSLYDTPDMSCGAGVVPSLADIPSYNDSVTRMIDSIVSTIQQVFVNDLGNFKESILVPKPLEAADQRKLEELESLLEFLTLPEETEKQRKRREKNKKFFDKLIPDQLSTQVSDFKNIHNALTTQASQTAADNIKDILAKQELLVAPETRTTYEKIEDNFLTASVLISDPSQDSQDAARFYSFASSLSYDRSLNGRDVLYSLPIDTQQQNDSVVILVTPLTEDSESLKNKTLDISENPNVLQTIAARAQREFLAGEFSGKIFDYFDNVVGDINEEQLKDISIRRLYPYFYFGLINSLAYKVSVSDLFNADAMNSLNLFPKLCKNGSISNSDLLDVNSIKQSALQEFVDNSCIDKESELGPVRDSGVLAIVELYMQVIVVDLVLKNIFMTSKFGIDYLGDADSIVNELLDQTVEDIRLGAVNTTLGPYNRLPRVVKQGAAMVIKKVINRSLEPNAPAFTYPISGELPEAQQQFVDSNNFEPSGVSNDNPTMQNIATQYLFEKRLLGTADKIKEFFKVPGDTYIQNYLYNGTQFVDMKQMDTADPLVGSEYSATNYFTKYNYIDQGRDVYELYYKDKKNGLSGSFSGSVSQKRIEKESNSFLTYGTFVAEKYFEVTYSEEGLEQFDLDRNETDTLRAGASYYARAARDIMGDLTPVSTKTNSKNYLLSFEKMVEILDLVGSALRLDSEADEIQINNINSLDPEYEQIFESIFPSILMKTRMVYITPETPEHSSFDDYFQTLNIDNETIKSHNTFYAVNNQTNSSKHIATNYEASIDVTSLFNEFRSKSDTISVNVYINNLFEDKKPELVQQLAVSLESLMGSPSPVNLASVMQYLYIMGEIKTYYDLFSNNDIFTDTKALLVLALQAAFGSVEDSPCDVDALQNALLSGADRSLAPMAAMGQSFLNKMLKETPKYILKGVVELTEPHVIVGKKIKDVSRGIFQKIKTVETFQALQNELPDAPANNSDCGPDLPALNAGQQSNATLANIPTLAEIISQMQSEIDRAFPDGFPDALKPSVTERGIDLVGTIPYTLFNPPITPFGIVYLLMRLSEFGQQELQIDENDC